MTTWYKHALCDNAPSSVNRHTQDVATYKLAYTNAGTTNVLAVGMPSFYFRLFRLIFQDQDTDCALMMYTHCPRRIPEPAILFPALRRHPVPDERTV